MFGNFTESALDISSVLWEVIGACLIPALLYFGYCSRKLLRNAWWYAAVFSVCFFWGWRLYFGTITSRYYLVMVLPSMLVIFHLAWNGLQRWRKVSYIVLLVLFAACLGRDFRSDPQIPKELALYAAVKKDAQKYKNPRGIAYELSAAQIEYYSGVKMTDTAYYSADLNILIDGLKNNLNMYYGMCDILYIFIPISQKYRGIEGELKNIMPNNLQIFARTFVDRRKKKELIVLKYIPQKEHFNTKNIPYFINGDFIRLHSGESLRKKHEYFGLRAPRFLTEKPELPQDWDLYVSLITKSDSLAWIDKRLDKNILRLQTNGSFISLISQYISAQTSYVIYFKTKVNRDSVLELRREYRNPGISKSVLATVIPLHLSKGNEYEFKWHLPKMDGMPLVRLWFFLSVGDIEINEIKIEKKVL